MGAAWSMDSFGPLELGMATPVLTDADVDRLAHMPDLTGAMIRAFRASKAGELVAPPRHSVAFAGGSLVFTVGGTDAIAGFRAYQTFQSGIADDQQVVCVWDTASARLKGVVLGNRLGALRAGALGGAAIDVMARRESRICGVVGTGRQAETQLMAAAAVRPLEEIRVFGRDGPRRIRFAEDAATRVGLPVRPVDEPAQAVVGADIVICATNSATPVLDSDWVSPGTHVTTVGPKQKGRHELPAELADRAAVIATDSPAQIAAQGDDHFLTDGGALGRVRDLADLAATGEQRPSNGITLYLSAGLAGTEVIIADLLLDLARRQG